MSRALEGYRIEGVVTSVSLLRRVLADERFVAGDLRLGLLRDESDLV